MTGIMQGMHEQLLQHEPPPHDPFPLSGPGVGTNGSGAGLGVER